jgi:hypothetical protein
VVQRRFRVLVEQLTGSDQVASHGVSGSTVQGAQLAPDFGRQLPGVHLWRYGRPGWHRAIGLAGIASRLGLARTARAGPAGFTLGARPASRCAPRRRARSPLTAVTLIIVDHSCRPPRLLLPL